jgi:hypothetical protein
MAYYQQGLNNAASPYDGAAIGGIESQEPRVTPRTIASASSRIDTLNERLLKAVEALGMISAQIGAMTPVSGLNNAKNGQTSPGGAVNRLNDSADEAHARISEIENYIQSIGRALG